VRTGLMAWCLGLLLALASVGGAQAQIWTEYRPAGGKYIVLMPGKPQESTESVPVGGGRTVLMYQALIERQERAYFGSYADYPQEAVSGQSPQTLLDNVRNGSAKGHSVRNEKHLTIVRNPGREYVIVRTDGVIAVTRIFLVGNRLYQIIAAGRTGVEDHPDTPWFLESFRLLTGN